MKIILKKEVANLGEAGEVVEEAAGTFLERFQLDDVCGLVRTLACYEVVAEQLLAREDGGVVGKHLVYLVDDNLSALLACARSHGDCTEDDARILVGDEARLCGGHQDAHGEEAGDDGNGGTNQYGYYVMCGDNGQIRRFWKNPATGNYGWGGDYTFAHEYYYNGDESSTPVVTDSRMYNTTVD